MRFLDIPTLAACAVLAATALAHEASAATAHAAAHGEPDTSAAAGSAASRQALAPW